MTNNASKMIKIFVVLAIFTLIVITVGISAYLFGTNRCTEKSKEQDTTDQTKTESLSEDYLINVVDMWESVETSPETFKDERNADKEISNTSCGSKKLRLFYKDFEGITDPSYGAAQVAYKIFLVEKGSYYLIHSSDSFFTQNSQEFTVFWNGDCTEFVIVGSFFDIQLPFYVDDRYYILYNSTENKEIKIIEIIEKQKKTLSGTELIKDLHFNGKDLEIVYTDGTKRLVDLSSDT